MAQRLEKSLSPQRAAPLPKEAALPQVIPQSVSSAPVAGANEDKGLVCVPDRGWGKSTLFAQQVIEHLCLMKLHRN